ncbi:MAG TPA: ABC transporter permease [Chloroflexota bacterium]|nr:ABC transporter permease [Chloroflexota bacterium]
MATTRPLVGPLAGEEAPELAEPGTWALGLRRLRRNRAAVAGFCVVALFYALALLSPLVAPYDPIEPHFADILASPVWAAGGTWTFPLGTDNLGRDLLSRLVHGARISMAIGLIPVAFYLLIGGTVGLVAGYAGGAVDTFLMRVVDVFYALPDLLIIISLVTLLRETAAGSVLAGMPVLIGALALFNWVGTARLVRGQVLAYKEAAFVEAARALGASPRRVVLHHIVPHVLAPLVVQMTFAIPAAIIAEAALGFIGIGVRPPTPSWGNMTQEGFGAFFTQPVLALAPAACIALVTLAFTFLGDGLRDALDPRMRV